jgi:hypothetical protein
MFSLAMGFVTGQDTLSSATGKEKDGTPKLTLEDLPKFSAKRRANSRHLFPGTPQAYSTEHSEAQSAFILRLVPDVLPDFHTSTSFLVTLSGGRVDHLQELFMKERIPDRWEPVARKRMGFTISSFAPSPLKVELGVKED